MSRAFALDRYRNIGIVAQNDAGKTTTTERILSVTGSAVEARLGDVGLAGLLARDITLSSAATSCHWRGCVLTIVHTPQSREASPEAERSLRALDGLITVLDGSTGQAWAADNGGRPWDRPDDLAIPRVCFINKLDRSGADFGATVTAASQRLSAVALVCQLPIYTEAGLVGVVDLVADVVRRWAEGAIPAILADQARDYRERLLTLANVGSSVNSETLRAAIRAGTIAGRFVPVLCGSAFESRGIVDLLDAVVDYLPSPADVAALHGVGLGGNEAVVVRNASDEEPFAGFAFNDLDDPAVGALTFVRVYSGILKSGARVLNPSRQAPEEIGRMIRIHANHREEVMEARTGDIVALAGLQNSRAGDTLCDPVQPVIILAGDLPAKVA